MQETFEYNCFSYIKNELDQLLLCLCVLVHVWVCCMHLFMCGYACAFVHAWVCMCVHVRVWVCMCVQSSIASVSVTES